MQIEEKRAEFYKEYYSGFSHHFSVVHKQFMPYDPLPGSAVFRTAAAKRTPTRTWKWPLKLRYAFREEFLEGNYYRFSLGSKYPIVELKYALGVKGIWKSNYSYHKATFIGV
ncbi:hypothetical protein [Chitinophaga caseinilytica]|uniref:hypothetical protein n=1 Tax=Chitinophaga caseinilytica TaxID=2267521 RepID=UPI003C2EF1EE